MSVRRLAEVQPPSFEFTPQAKAWVDRQIAKYPEHRQASAVIPLLWQAQKQNDYWLPKPAIEKVADMLGMPYIRVLEVATFYTMFNLAPVGKYLHPDVRHDAVHAARLGRHQGRAARARRRPGACDGRRPVLLAARSNASAPAAMRRWCRSTTTITRI